MDMDVIKIKRTKSKFESEVEGAKKTDGVLKRISIGYLTHITSISLIQISIGLFLH